MNFMIFAENEAVGKLRSAGDWKNDLFAADFHQQKLLQLGDPLLRIASCIGFPALAAEVDRAAPRPVSPQGGRPPYSTETMVRILVLKRLYNLPRRPLPGAYRERSPHDGDPARTCDEHHASHRS